LIWRKTSGQVAGNVAALGQTGRGLAAPASLCIVQGLEFQEEFRVQAANHAKAA